jgi:hypothetical protein
LGALLVAHTLLLVGLGLPTVACPNSLGLDELQIADIAWYWQHGTLPYFGAGFPAVFNPYGPALTWLLSWLSPDAATVPVVGRLVSLAAVGALTVVIATAAPRPRARFWVAAAVLAFLSTRPAFNFAMRCRTDALAAGAAIAGYALATRTRHTPTAVLAVLLMALATLTKVTAVAAPLAAWCCLRHPAPRRGWAILGGWAALVLVGYGALQAATDGLFLASIGRPANHWGRSLEMASRPFTLSAGWMLALIAGLLRVPSQERREWLGLAWYAALTFAVAVVTGAAWGSHWGYVLEFFGVQAIAFALVTHRLVARRDVVGLKWVSVWLTIHFAIAVPSLAGIGGRYLRAGREQTADLPAAEAALAPWLRDGRRVAVLGHWPANEALLRLGQPNVLDRLELCPLDEREHAREVARALDSGLVDVVLRGPALQPWDPRVLAK